MQSSMRDFAYRYQNDPISDFCYYNQERQILADKIIQYNDLRVKKSIAKNKIASEMFQTQLDNLTGEIWGYQKC